MTRPSWILAVLTAAALAVPASTASAHPLVVEGVAQSAPLSAEEQLVTFQCSALDALAPLGTQVKWCAAKSLVDLENVNAQFHPANNLAVGTAVLKRGRYLICANGSVQHPLGLYQETGTQCRESVVLTGTAVILLTL